MRKQIGNAIRKHRILNNYTQRHMANQLKISIASYSNIENGKALLTVEVLYTICTILKIEDWKEILPDLSNNMNTVTVNNNAPGK